MIALQVGGDKMAHPVGNGQPVPIPPSRISAMSQVAPGTYNPPLMAGYVLLVGR